MSNRSMTPPESPERLDTHMQLLDAEDSPVDWEAELQSTPTQRKRHLDHDEQSYIPGAQGHVTDQPPKKKRKTASSLQSYVKLNVIREAVTVQVHGAPTEDRQPKCLISSVSDKMTVLEFSHVMDGSTPSKEMDCLEWSWNRKYYSLNVNTRKNLQIIRVTLHRWFNLTEASKPVGWFWLPVDLSILINMHATYVGNVFILPEAGEKTNVRKDPESFYEGSCKFRYQLIPLSGMEASCSVKRYTGNAFGPFDPNLIKYSVYPFTDFPLIELHVPYHFVIVNTGKKLFQLYGKEAINFERDFPFLSAAQKIMMTAVRNIYVAWTTAMPPKWFTEGDYGDKQRSATGRTHLPGEAGSDGGPQGGGMPHGGKDGGGEAQDDVAISFGAMMGQRQAASGSLAPWDSASCLKLVDEGNEEDVDDPFVDDEDDEYENVEFFEGLKQWASDVWTATHSDSASDAEETLVGGTAVPVSCKGVDVPATLETLPLLSVQ